MKNPTQFEGPISHTMLNQAKDAISQIKKEPQINESHKNLMKFWATLRSLDKDLAEVGKL